MGVCRVGSANVRVDREDEEMGIGVMWLGLLGRYCGADG